VPSAYPPLNSAHAGALLVLTAVAVIYAWPLLARLTTAMPGGPSDLDVATMVWNVGWVHHALTRSEPLLRSDDVLVPFGADLRLHTYGLLQGMLAAPLVALVGVPGAFNLMLVGTLWLNGVALYVLGKTESGSALAALVGAVCFMLAAPILDQLRVGRPTFASLWITIAALLVMRRLLRGPRWWLAVALGALLLAALFTDFQIVLFTGLWLAAYGIARVRLRHLGALGAAGLIAAVPFGLVFYPALSADQYPRPSLSDMQEYSFRTWDFLDPTVLPHAVGIELAVAAVAAIALRRNLVWLVGGLAFVVLSLGPFLQPTQIPLPFAGLSVWPPLAQFRTPYRLAMPAVLGLAVVLCCVLASLVARWPASIRIVAVGALVAVRLGLALVQDPLQTQTYPTYAVYQQLAAAPGRFTIVEVPFGVRSGLERIGDGGEVLEFYQHVHGQALLNAMVARLPRGVFETYRGHASLRFLAGEDVAPSADDFREVLTWTNAGYVLVHRDLLRSDQAERIVAFLDAQPAVQRVATEGELDVYRAILSAR
jgi:hypothetical protein